MQGTKTTGWKAFSVSKHHYKNCHKSRAAFCSQKWMGCHFAQLFYMNVHSNFFVWQWYLCIIHFIKGSLVDYCRHLHNYTKTFKTLLIRDMVVECYYRWFVCDTIHPTQKLTSMNLLQMPCVITWVCSILTSEVAEAFRGQKHHILMRTFNSTFGSS